MEKKSRKITGKQKNGERFQTAHLKKGKRCYFCFHPEIEISYKDYKRLKRYITDWGKIIPASKTRVCSFHQRQLSREIKKARILALLPSGARKTLLK